MESDAEAERLGIEPGRVRRIRPGPGADPDLAWPQFHAEFLRILKDDYGYHPARDLKVSVIVPNYNHARYLEERLRSIFGQTHRPHEILFLDDASSDAGSVAVAQRLAAKSPVPFQIIVNETNNGSTFRQWLKGIDLACGDLVWIAESDDACQPELLERLVPEFFDPAVALAYCQSAVIGPDGQKYADDYISLTNEISLTHWRHSYNVSGVEEVELALSQRNTIPNASAVLFRRPPDLDCRTDLERMRLAGDWLFYAMQIRDGRISFVPDALQLPSASRPDRAPRVRTGRGAGGRAVARQGADLRVVSDLAECDRAQRELHGRGIRASDNSNGARAAGTDESTQAGALAGGESAPPCVPDVSRRATCAC